MTTLRKMEAMCLLKRLNSGSKLVCSYKRSCDNMWSRDFWFLLELLKLVTPFEKKFNIYTNDIQCLYDSTNKLSSLNQIDHDVVSLMTEVQSAVEKLKMFLEVETLDEIKKKLNKYYMVITFVPPFIWLIKASWVHICPWSLVLKSFRRCPKFFSFFKP